MVDVTVIAMWAHPRAVSTAFLRMMIERGDVTVLHEPLVLLTDTGQFELPGPVAVRSIGELFGLLRGLAQTRPVFFKDTLEYHYQYLFDHPDEIAEFHHTFIVREPAAAIASHYAVKSEVTCPEIGYEHQYELFELVREVSPRKPVVISAERLLADPAEVISAYCTEVGLPYLPHALHWAPGERREWQQNRRWHTDAIASSGFQLPSKQFAVTVENDARLRSFYDHHRPFYDRLVEHAL